MPEIQAFRAVRYNLGQVGQLSDVIAPPYDVISPEMQSDLYKKHPCNVVRLILNRQEPGDDESNNRYTRARDFLKQWRKQGVLFTEADPALYVYHQHFSYAGAEYNRRGFMCRLRLSRFGEGKVFPHEETHSAAKQDRLMLTTTCKANLSQVFGLYPDARCEAQNLLEKAVAGATPLEATDHLGVLSRVWPVTDPKVVADVAAVMGPKPMFIADGHHRYETACNYRDHVAQMGLLTPEHPANFVLMMCVAMEDPGLAVMPTHRLFTGVPKLTAAELTAKLGECFKTQVAGQGPDYATTVWEEIETENNQGTIGLYAAKDDRWVLARLTPAGATRMAEVAKEHNEAWRGLGVSLLHRLVVETLLGVKDMPKPNYVHLVEEVVEGLKTGEYPLAAVVMPATVDDIRQISMTGERMPAKSTYFYPKLLSGLVINPLE
ncbi:MAG TPA: DUF1015 domain-containing protein [Thermoguttaceae bacterium]|nr:DUF1015 domain-containing protein [Thermoguttaceae bacterium]